MSGRTIIHGKTTSNNIVPIQCNADGTLEMTAEISSAGLATEAKQDDMIVHLADIDNQTNSLLTYQVLINGNQTNGNQKCQILGNTEADGSGDSHHIHVDGSGNVLVKEVGTVNVAPSNDTNSGITNDPANSMAVGLRGRTDIADASTETFLKCDANGVLETSGSGGGGGDATAANQTLQLAQETVTATNSSSIDNKISQGSDATLTDAQQVLCYGRDSGGALDAFRTDASGHLEVVMDDFVKGQDTMANSLPVVIASDQSDVSINAPQLPASLGQKANSNSLSICRSSTTGAFDLSARTTIATAGTSTKLLCDSDGVLQVSTLRDPVVTAVSTTNVLANGTFTSSVIDLQGFSMMTMIGNTTNLTDNMFLEVSVDNITFFKDPLSVQYDYVYGDFKASVNQNGNAGAIRYVRLTQTDTTATAFTVQFGASRR